MLINQEDSFIGLGKAYIDSYAGNGSKSHPYRLLRRIFEYAHTVNLSNEQSREVVFSWQDLRNEQDPDDDGHTLKKRLKLAEEKWAQHLEDLNQKAYEQGLSHFPVFERLHTGGGAGNLTKYRIRQEPVKVECAVDTSSLPKGFIRYSVEISDKTNPFIRAVDGLVTKGVKLYALIGAMVTVIAFGTGCALLGVFLLLIQDTTYGLLSTILYTCATIYGLYAFFSPVYYTVTKRIIIAPTSLSPRDKYSSQVEYVPTGELHPDGKPIRQFRIVTYVSECPICGGRVDIEQGSWSMRNRLVGTCTNSPREHIYTFDHQSRIGKLIHHEYHELL